MSCCGKKRAEWLQETKGSSRQDISETVDLRHTKEHKPKVFEYVSDQNLTLKGINSGKVYHFRFPGEKIEVAYEDSFAMMAERDLKITGTSGIKS